MIITILIDHTFRHPMITVNKFVIEIDGAYDIENLKVQSYPNI